MAARRWRRPGRALKGTGALRAGEAGLGFPALQSQRAALAEIAGDMAAPLQMMRLLQGDVGSGKTIVALMAMLIAAGEACAQAAPMAPDRHRRRGSTTPCSSRLAAPAGVAVGLLTGREKAPRAADGDRSAASPRADDILIVVGTRRLHSDHGSPRYRDLARSRSSGRAAPCSGVEQRLALAVKSGDAADTFPDERDADPAHA